MDEIIAQTKVVLPDFTIKCEPDPDSGSGSGSDSVWLSLSLTVLLFTLLF